MEETDSAFGASKSRRASDPRPGRPHAPHPEIRQLRQLATVRSRATQCLSVCLAREPPKGDHFSIDTSNLDAAAEFVLSLAKRDYPDGQAGVDVGKIPGHSRWRHFEAGGVDRIKPMLERWEKAHMEPLEKLRRMIDLTVVSVLLDAGAGDSWSFTDSDGKKYPRSEGLGIASLKMFQDGLFSADPKNKEQVDATALATLSLDALSSSFQITATNPLLGLEGRHALLLSLSSALKNPTYFSPPFGKKGAGRPGYLADYLLDMAETIDANEYGANGRPSILLSALWDALVTGLAPIWPATRTKLHGVNMGDVWPISLLGGDLVPFHKLTQWMCYSLVEVFERVGNWSIVGSGLTGLPEYRNGGLLIDFGILTPLEPPTRPLPASDPLIVEWRALTIPLLDMIATKIREKLGVSEAELPLAKILEMGTWKAGREIAREKRTGGGPPISVESDGTVF